MKRWTWKTMWVVALMPLTAAQADHRIDWDEWYAGNVDVRVALQRGEGAVLLPGEPVEIEFKTNESAYHLVYGIDTDGYVRLLFPRYWEDDGWVKAGRKVRLRAEDLAWPADRWGSDGVVYIEVVASPTPFDFVGSGLVREASSCAWYDDHALLRVQGDPFLAFNGLHRRLFRDWDNAVFAVDYTYFYVGDYYDAPRYLGYRYRRVYVPPPHSGFYVGVRFGWSWEFGYGYCRPVYARYYLPGVHYVHHHVHNHHHVAYGQHHDRYARHGHYGYHDGWHGSRYRVVHDTKHRRRITRPPARKRHESVVRLRESLEKRAKRRDGAGVRNPRHTDPRGSVDVARRERSERATELARKRLAPRRSSAPRRESVEAGRRAQRVAPRAAVEPRVERGSKSVSRGRSVALEKRGKETPRGGAAKRAESPRRSQHKHTVGSKERSAGSKNSTVSRSKRVSRSEVGAKRSSERKKSVLRVAKDNGRGVGKSNKRGVAKNDDRRVVKESKRGAGKNGAARR